MQAGASTIISNDIDPYSIIATVANAKEKGTISALFVSDTDFLGAQEERLQSSVEEIELLSAKTKPEAMKRRYCLVGDMLYDLPMSSNVMKMVQGLKYRGWIVLVGDPGRQYAVSNPSHLGNLLREYPLPKEVAVQNNGLISTSVYELT
jgi:predicted nicotinamide N-methyase